MTIEQFQDNAQLWQSVQNEMLLEEVLNQVLQTGKLTEAEYSFYAERLAANGSQFFTITAYCYETGRNGSVHSYVVTWDEIMRQLEEENLYVFQEDSFIRIEVKEASVKTRMFGKDNIHGQELVRVGCLNLNI